MYGQESAVYLTGDLVLYGGYIYKAVTFNTTKVPRIIQVIESTFEGYNFRGDWNNEGTEDSGEIAYKTGDFVRLTGNLYIASQDSTNFNQTNGLLIGKR